MKVRELNLAHSPDADDIFMYYALHFGWVGDEGIRFRACAKDIQTLNFATLNGEYDVCAISFALYPLVCKDYVLLETGVSFGEGYGPKLIKRKDVTLRANFRVALSGKHTSNALLFRVKYPSARIIYKNFLDIEKAVLDGEVDAGVLIHESILTYNKNLVVEAELWDIWCELSKDSLPLPLGGMVISRSLPLNIALSAQEVLKKAVCVAVKNKEILSCMLLERNLVRVDDKDLDTYLNLYANEHSICLGEEQLASIDILFKLGFDNGFYKTPISVRDYMLPREYNKLRFGL